MGDKGIAHWDYKDWADTVMDAWVLQLGEYPLPSMLSPECSTNAPSGLLVYLPKPGMKFSVILST